MGKPSYFVSDFAKMDKEQRARYDLGVSCKKVLVMLEHTPHQLHTALEILEHTVKNVRQHLDKK